MYAVLKVRARCAAAAAAAVAGGTFLLLETAFTMLLHSCMHLQAAAQQHPCLLWADSWLSGGGGVKKGGGPAAGCELV